MRALQLFEADFNWILKKLLSHKVMKKAREEGTLPDEAYSVAGTSATEATLTRILWSDTNRLQHKSFAIVSADLGQCYDSIAHVPCSLSLQAFGTPRKLATMTLYALQVMKYWLRTAYGDAEQPFGGTREDSCMGLGQGSGASNLACTTTLTLPIMHTREGTSMLN